VINLTESVSSLPSHLTHPWRLRKGGLFCERAPPRATTNANDNPFCEFQQDMMQVADA